MKKVLNITKHEDGTYTLNRLTHEQMHAIQSALINNCVTLLQLKEKKQREGLDLNAIATFYLAFSYEASNQLEDLGF